MKTNFKLIFMSFFSMFFSSIIHCFFIEAYVINLIITFAKDQIAAIWTSGASFLWHYGLLKELVAGVLISTLTIINPSSDFHSHILWKVATKIKIFGFKFSQSSHFTVIYKKSKIFFTRIKMLFSIYFSFCV